MKKPGAYILSILIFTTIVFTSLHFIFLNSLTQRIAMGAVVGEKAIVHTFRIVNYSLSPLVLGAPTTSCGCTVVGQLPAAVKPFASLSVPVNINLTGRSGAFKSNVVLDLGSARAAKFEITADVYPAMSERIDLGNVEASAIVHRTFAASLDRSQLEERTAHPAIDVALDDIEGHSILRVAVRVPGDSGEFSIPMYRDFPSPLFSGTVLRSIEPDVPILSMGYLYTDKTTTNSASRTVTFRSPYNYSFRWREDLGHHSDLVTIKESTRGAERTLEIQLRPPDAIGMYRETLGLSFELEGKGKTVHIPLDIYAYILEPKQ